MQYPHALSAKTSDWLKLARILLTERQNLLLLDVTEHALADCISLAQEFNYRFIYESDGGAKALKLPASVGLVPNKSCPQPNGD